MSFLSRYKPGANQPGSEPKPASAWQLWKRFASKSRGSELLLPEQWIELSPSYGIEKRETTDLCLFPMERLVLKQIFNYTSDEMEDVIALAKAGNYDAFWSIALQLHDRLVAYCCNKSFGHPEYKDVVTSVLLEFQQKLPSFKETTLSEVGSHLLFLAGKRCIDAHRKRQRMRQLPIDPSGQSIDPECEGLPSGFGVEVVDEWRSIVLCLQSKDVSEDFIRTWWLKRVEDMSYKEIAELLGIAEDTVGSRIYRTNAKIKECVEGAKS
jgi:RNA polymerase sigma-70 factor (ECF subfamily)